MENTENTENTSTNSFPLDFGSFSENPFFKLIASGDIENNLKEFFSPATFGVILLFFAGLYYSFSKQIQNAIRSTKQSVHQSIKTKITQLASPDQESSPSFSVRILQYLDALFSDSNEEEEDEPENEPEDEPDYEEEDEEEEEENDEEAPSKQTSSIGI